MSRRKNVRQRRNRNQPPSKQGSARWRRRRQLGQNFLRNARDAERIAASSGVRREDLVVEFGPGSGMLTTALAKRTERVIVVEYDRTWANLLRERFSDSRVEILNADARRFRLPKSPFKVVANVPFGITTDLLSHLMEDPTCGPSSGTLLVQDDVARKHASRSRTSLKTLSWSPFYEFSTGLKLPASAFHPRPRVDARLLRFRRRDAPLISPEDKADFEAFVRRAFRFGTPNGVGVPLRKEFSKKRMHALAGEIGFSLDDPPSHLDVRKWAEVFSAMRS